MKDEAGEARLDEITDGTESPHPRRCVPVGSLTTSVAVSPASGADAACSAVPSAPCSCPVGAKRPTVNFVAMSAAVLNVTLPPLRALMLRAKSANASSDFGLQCREGVHDRQPGRRRSFEHFSMNLVSFPRSMLAFMRMSLPCWPPPVRWLSVSYQSSRMSAPAGVSNSNGSHVRDAALTTVVFPCADRRSRFQAD
jgi:hypothetical protein